MQSSGKPNRPRSIPYDFYVYSGSLDDAAHLEPLSLLAVKEALKRYPDSLPQPDGYTVSLESVDGGTHEARVILDSEAGGPCTMVVVRFGLEAGAAGFERSGRLARYLATALDAQVFDPQAHLRLGARERTGSWDEALAAFERQRETFRALLPHSDHVQPHNGKPRPRWMFWRK